MPVLQTRVVTDCLMDHWSPIAFAVWMGVREGTSAHKRTRGLKFQSPNPSRKLGSLAKSTSVLEEDWIWFSASTWKLTIPFSSSSGDPTPSSDLCGLLHSGDAPHTYAQYTQTQMHTHICMHTHTYICTHSREGICASEHGVSTRQLDLDFRPFVHYFYFKMIFKKQTGHGNTCL